MRYSTFFKFFALAAVGMASSIALAGDIIGIVETEKGVRVEFAVVNITEATGSFKPTTIAMDQVNKEFIPHVLAVLKGTTVRFLNSDPYFHNVFSNSKVKTFNVSQAKKGDFSEMTFDKVGIVPIRCHIHANMKAYVVILANPYFNVTNAQGQFRISNVPAGTYSLKVWGEQFPSQTQTVTVPATGNAKAIFKVVQ
jgi:plastocyanin